MQCKVCQVPIQDQFQNHNVLMQTQSQQEGQNFQDRNYHGKNLQVSSQNYVPNLQIPLHRQHPPIHCQILSQQVPLTNPQGARG